VKRERRRYRPRSAIAGLANMDLIESFCKSAAFQAENARREFIAAFSEQAV
jgi:hypothetical protein